MTKMIEGSRGGNPTIECPDCGRWCYVGDSHGIRHSKRCDIGEEIEATRHANAVAESRRRQLVKAAKDGSLRTIATDDEIAEAVAAGWIASGDAMNQDF